MKTKLLIAALITGVAATSVTAAGFGRGEGAGSFGPRGGIAAMDFATVDANADGSITLEELQALPAAKFAEADTDGDGFLSAEELTAQVTAQMAERAAARVEQQITSRDTNGDGVLSLEELQPTDTTRLTSMFERLDADSDGNVTAEEFAAFETAMAQRGQMRGGDHGDRGGRDGGPRNNN